MTERRSWQVLTSGHLQFIALVTMTVDHVGALLLPQQDFLRIIGRLAFPLYCLMIAEGFSHTADRKKYFARLMAFAIVSVVPFGIFEFLMTEAPLLWSVFAELFLEELLGNVIFELALGFGVLWVLSKGKLGWLAVPAGMILSEMLDLMYGWYGIAMIVCFYVFRDRRDLQAVSAAVLTVAFSYATVLLAFIRYYTELSLGRLLLRAAVRITGYVQTAAVFAAAPILLYNGERGRRMPRYLGYAYYPGHLLVLDLLYIFFH